MLLEALVACAGVTLKAVATALEFRLNGGTVQAEGDLDFRGTLGVDRTAPVGFREIRLAFALDTDEPQDRIDTLLKLTERYCVVLQTLRNPPADLGQDRETCNGDRNRSLILSYLRHKIAGVASQARFAFSRCVMHTGETADHGLRSPKGGARPGNRPGASGGKSIEDGIATRRRPV